MDSQERIINRDLVIGWTSIVIILFITYAIEVLKGQRTLPYLGIFMLFTALPALVTIILYRKNPFAHYLRYFIVIGYFFMYGYVMITGSTILVFTYIFPLLSMIILYHQEKLILGMGIAAILMNAVSIGIQLINGEITISNSKDMEIQIALLLLCFAGSYTAAKLYGNITGKNTEYMQMLDETSKQIQKMSLQSITTIANTIDAKDEYTKGHSQRVADYSYALARELGMSEEECMDIRNIALLHDIGKIGVPDSILNKPGKLTEEEFRIMKQHPVVGSEILKDIRLLPNLDVGARYHHERYDGKGYPSGLMGEEIPLIARIICITDSYDAMSSNRVYRKGFSDDWILAEIERCKGKQFDPELADAFLRLLRKKKVKRLSNDELEIQAEMQAEIQKAGISPSKSGEKRDILDELSDVNRIKNVEFNITQELKYEEGCLILIDVDNISEINENYGYLRGDYCLGMIARMLLKPKRNLIVSRVEGDEFLCFLPAVNSMEEAEKKVFTLMHDLNDEISQKEELQGITLSAGAALSVISGKEYAQMFMDADKALYHVKKQSKNGYFIYSDNPKNDHSCTSQNDLHQLVELLQREESETIVKPAFHEFTRIYDFIRNIEKHDAASLQLILFTLKPKDKKTFSLEDRLSAMKYLENAITKSTSGTEDTTQYSRTQQLVIFKNLSDEEIQKTTDQITKVFYRMYDKKDIIITHDATNLNIES